MQRICATLLLCCPLMLWANNECTREPKVRWMSAADLEAAVRKQGFQIRKAKFERSCFEIYGLDAVGRKVEAAFDPVTARLVRLRRD
jgi:hypothetical protein